MDTPALALVIEDEPLIALDLEASLARRGFRVVSLRSRRESDIWLTSHSPDVAVVDVRLTDGQSDDIAGALHARGIPFIVHSGDLEASFSNTQFAHGMWISKPGVDNHVADEALKLAHQ